MITSAASVEARLAKIEGQVRGVQRMIADGRPLLEILTQIRAAERALDEVGLALVEDELRNLLPADDDAPAAVIDCVRRVAAHR